MTMNDDELLRNADFLDIAMEQMDESTVEYDFVADVRDNLVKAVDDQNA